MAKITGVEARVLVNHFRCVMEKKGYVFFEGKKPYDLNIVGVRSFNMRANKFDDSINVFYKNTKKIGLHRGSYEALVQRGENPVQIYRDSNKDEILDMEKNSILEGHFGINIHKSGSDSKIVEKWSAGCQVFKTSSDFKDFMTLVNRAAKYWGPSFTYTLLEEKDFEECK